MQKEHFYNALDDVKSKLPPLRDELIDLTQTYPWFSAAHLLVAKTDHLTGHVAFDANLKRAAVYAGQREALFDLIHKEAFTDKVRAFEEEVERFEEESDEVREESSEYREASSEVREASEESGETSLSSEELEVVDDASADAIQPEQEKDTDALLERKEALVSEEEDPIETGESVDVEETSEPVEGEATSNEVEEIAEIKHLDDFDDLQREILLEAISSSIEKEVQEEKEIEVVEKPEEKTTRVQETKTDDSEIKPSSFTALLKKRSADIKWDGGTEGAPEIPVIAEDKPSDKLAPDQLIDKFIATDPKITPRKSAEFSKENLAKKSLVEDEQFVTETIARIYAKQGATGKAIKAYKLLSLKYPEKSIYFAHQIKKLQDRRKSTK